MRIFLIFISFLMACSANKSTQTPNANAALNGPLVTLRTEGCRGYCPVYQLSFSADGMMVYEGIRNMAIMSKESIKLSEEDRKLLQTSLETANVWQYPNRIETNIADAPSATITVYKAGKEHAVWGSIDRPKPLLELELVMKNIAERNGIPVKQGVDPNAPPEIPQTRLIVLLQENVNAGNWSPRYDQYKLRLQRRLGAENRWMITYDPATQAVESMLTLLRADKDVVQVQEDKSTKQNRD